jgi:hypothetical protein
MLSTLSCSSCLLVALTLALTASAVHVHAQSVVCMQNLHNPNELDCPNGTAYYNNSRAPATKTDMEVLNKKLDWLICAAQIQSIGGLYSHPTGCGEPPK